MTSLPQPPPKPPRPRATGRVTLADVAAAAGVSTMTVSRALRGDRNVASDLVERVRAAAAALAYVPDPAAQMLASSRSRAVAVLVPLLSNRVFGDLLEAVQRCLMPAGYQTLFGVTHYNPLEEERLLQSFLAQRPAGLLVTGFDSTEAGARMLLESGVPCVHLMETVTSPLAITALTALASGAAASAEPAPPTYCVGFSQTDAGFAVTQHLIDQGRQRIAFVAAQLDPRVMQRAAGYRACLQQAGLYDAGLELMNPQPSSIALGGQLFRQMRAEHADVDAMFFCNDDLAQGGLLVALRDGVKVPEHIAIAGFNDLEGSDQMLPALTTIRTPRAEIGTQAAQLLLALMRGEEVAASSVDVGYELIRRGST